MLEFLSPETQARVVGNPEYGISHVTTEVDGARAGNSKSAERIGRFLSPLTLPAANTEDRTHHQLQLTDSSASRPLPNTPAATTTVTQQVTSLPNQVPGTRSLLSAHFKQF